MGGTSGSTLTRAGCTEAKTTNPHTVGVIFLGDIGDRLLNRLESRAGIGFACPQNLYPTAPKSWGHLGTTCATIAHSHGNPHEYYVLLFDNVFSIVKSTEIFSHCGI